MIVEDEELFDEDPDRGFDPVVVTSAAREPVDFDRLLIEMARMWNVTAHVVFDDVGGLYWKTVSR
jgi:hypothetical protein